MQSKAGGGWKGSLWDCLAQALLLWREPLYSFLSLSALCSGPTCYVVPSTWWPLEEGAVLRTRVHMYTHAHTILLQTISASPLKAASCWLQFALACGASHSVRHSSW